MKIIKNIWIHDRFSGNEFTGIPVWRQEEHDSDLDGVPNYLDISPLNPNVGRRAYVEEETEEEVIE